MVGSTAETAEREAEAEAAAEAAEAAAEAEAAAAAATAAASPVSAASAVTSPAGSPVEVDGPRASPQPNRPRNDAAYTLTGFAAGSGDAEEMSFLRGNGAPGRPRPSACGGDNQPPDGCGGEGAAADAHREEARAPAGEGGVTSGLRHCYVGCEASAAATGEGGLGGGTLARGHPSPDFLRHGQPTDGPVG